MLYALLGLMKTTLFKRGFYSKMHNNKKAKRISVNDINYRDGNYPLLFEVYFIYRANNSNSNIPSIVKWFDTNEGQEFIEKIK